MKSQFIPLLICSSENTFDVFRETLRINKSFLTNYPGPIYVGINGQIFDSKYVLKYVDFIVGRPNTSNWNSELIDQLKILKHDFSVDHIVMLLDDFIIYHCDYSLLRVASEFFIKYNLSSLRLTILPDHLIRLIVDYFSPFRIYTLPISPYYSSLQPSIWSVSHLINLLEINNQGTIWSFEHLILGKHHACSKKVIANDHLIEKGNVRLHILSKLISKNLYYPNIRRPVIVESVLRQLLVRIKILFTAFRFSSLRNVYHG